MYTLDAARVDGTLNLFLSAQAHALNERDFENIWIDHNMVFSVSDDNNRFCNTTPPSVRKSLWRKLWILLLDKTQ